MGIWMIDTWLAIGKAHKEERGSGRENGVANAEED